MTVIATGTISGPEARGDVNILRSQDDALTVEIKNFWVAPGAPDVRLYLSPHPDGAITDAVDLGHVPNAETQFSRLVPTGINEDQIRSVVIYCKVYSVLFGDAALTWL